MAGSTGAGGLIEFDISVSDYLGRNGRAIQCFLWRCSSLVVWASHRDAVLAMYS